MPTRVLLPNGHHHDGHQHGRGRRRGGRLHQLYVPLMSVSFLYILTRDSALDNLPAEIAHLLAEIEHKDRRYNGAPE